MTDELEQQLTSTMATLSDGLSDGDFSEVIREISKTRLDRTHEEYRDFVDSLIDDLAERIRWDDDGPNDQDIADWIREACTMGDEPWDRMIIALESAT